MDVLKLANEIGKSLTKLMDIKKALLLIQGGLERNATIYPQCIQILTENLVKSKNPAVFQAYISTLQLPFLLMLADRCSADNTVMKSILTLLEMFSRNISACSMFDAAVSWSIKIMSQRLKTKQFDALKTLHHVFSAFIRQAVIHPKPLVVCALYAEEIHALAVSQKDKHLLTVVLYLPPPLIIPLLIHKKGETTGGNLEHTIGELSKLQTQPRVYQIYLAAAASTALKLIALGDSKLGAELLQGIVALHSARPVLMGLLYTANELAGRGMPMQMVAPALAPILSSFPPELREDAVWPEVMKLLSVAKK
eukprot:gnl/Dysnectes_brevis/7788_a13407_332.p1 GENE.gnl/Dysnectes_brevis/7788_a13407_332~~gnl/Dysnectes_brevis/7788_a13407_332.p1  ORF type:complete len:309 (+),score=44.63 gnl/Dysnectes_brevis/7788_a13407_332:99-1025(+)